VWKHLTHANIAPLLGVTIAPFQLALSWMSGGDLPDYIKRYPDADRLGLVSAPPAALSHAYSRHKLCDVAGGLCYLHSRNMVHGNLKGVRDRPKSRFITALTSDQSNVLIDDSGHARITDFGLTRVTQGLSQQHVHTARWTAPEVLNEGPRSKEADIFSFAMVIIEVCHGRPTVCRASIHCRFALIQVFTGAVPFSNTPSVTAVLVVTQGERPPRPTHPIFTANLWTLMQRCWDNDPHLRPEAPEVLQILLTLLVSHSFRRSSIC